MKKDKIFKGFVYYRDNFGKELFVDESHYKFFMGCIVLNPIKNVYDVRFFETEFIYYLYSGIVSDDNIDSFFTKENIKNHLFCYFDTSFFLSDFDDKLSDDAIHLFYEGFSKAGFRFACGEDYKIGDYEYKDERIIALKQKFNEFCLKVEELS